MLNIVYEPKGSHLFTLEIVLKKAVRGFILVAKID